MKLLRLDVFNTQIFGDSVSIDFMTRDGVRRAVDDDEYVQRAYRLDPGLYSQVLLAFTGYNASGKTSSLQLISLLLQLVLQGDSLNTARFNAILTKLMKRKADRLIPFSWNAYFQNEKYMYKLHSDISFGNLNLPGNIPYGYYFSDERIYRKDFSYKAKRTSSDFPQNTLFDFNEEELCLSQADDENNPYFRKDISIGSRIQSLTKDLIHSKESAKSVKLKESKNRKIQNVSVESLIELTDWNLPLWSGQPDTPLVECLDLGIKRTSISSPAQGEPLRFEVQYKNQPGITYNGRLADANHYLSSGTIKGITLFPALVRAFRTGGYVIIDEFEDHFNKKLIEWFFELFENRRINPKGACLIFSTHYPEILDTFRRNDNIYVTRKREDYTVELVRFSDRITRKDILKSKILLYNVIEGTAPLYQELKAARQRLEELVVKG